MTKRNPIFQVLLLLFSTAGGLAVSLVVSVLNTHALNPESYGAVRYTTNLMTFFSSLLFLGFFVSGSRLLAVSQSESEKRSLRGAMFLILMAVVLVNMLLLSIWGYCLAPDAESQEVIFWSLAVCSAPSLLYYINTVCQGDNQILRISLGRVLPALCYLATAYWLYQHIKVDSRIMLLLQNGIAAVILLLVVISTGLSFRKLRTAFRSLGSENRRYGWPVYCGSVANISLSYLAGITLAFFADGAEGKSSVAFYTLALTLSMPLTMLPSIIGTVFFKRFASENFIHKKVILYSTVLTFAAWGFYTVLIYPVVDWFYPENYQSVARWSCLLAFGMACHGLGDMFNRFLGAHAQGRYIRNGAIVSGLVLFAGNVVLVWLWSLPGAVLTRILGSLASCGCMVGYYIKYVYYDSRKVAAPPEKPE